jgi:hypothetical protein
MRRLNLELFALALILSFATPVASGQGLVGQRPPRYGLDGKLETPAPEEPLNKGPRTEAFTVEPRVELRPLGGEQHPQPAPAKDEDREQSDSIFGDIVGLISFGLTGLAGVGLGVVLTLVVLAHTRSRRKPGVQSEDQMDLGSLIDRIELHTQILFKLGVAEKICGDLLDARHVTECGRQLSKAMEEMRANSPDMRRIDARLAHAKRSLSLALHGEGATEKINGTLPGFLD